MTPRELLSQFQAIDKYARYDGALWRRERWEESVSRSIAWLDLHTGMLVSKATIDEIIKAENEMTVLPSMRLVAMGGPAAERDHAHIYNCEFTVVDSLRVFGESVASAMAGVGVAFSVERMHIDRLPKIKYQSGKVMRYVVEDSAGGWADAVQVGVESWFTGHDVEFDLSNIRKAGAVLHTKGGRASGPEPLRKMLDEIRSIILSSQGDYLRPIHAYDIFCWIGWASVSGGVRHTAMAVLFDFDDKEMLAAKGLDYYSNQHLQQHTKRALANNSAVIASDLSYEQWRSFLLNGALGNTGEPNFFNRLTALSTMPRRRYNRLSEYNRRTLGVNVCGEVFLVPQQFCNLTMLKLENGIDEQEILHRVKLATVLGMMQATCTYFPTLRQEWKQNAIDETILGVCPSGWMECDLAMQPGVMAKMKQVASDTAIEYAQILDIKPPTAIGSVKPAGNSSLLADVSAGVHCDYYPYYVRNVTIQKTSPLLDVLEKSGVPIVPISTNDKAVYAVFPIEGRGKLRSEMSAIDQLETHLAIKEEWCEHNVSQTVTFKPGEEDDIIAFVYENQHRIAGVTFLRESENVYADAPIREVSKEEYERMLKKFPQEIDWSLLDETEDYTSFPVGCDGERCTL